MKNILYKILIITFILCFLCGCGGEEPAASSDASVKAPIIVTDYDRYAQTLSEASDLPLTAKFLRKFEKENIKTLVSLVESGNYTMQSWLEITGYSYHVVSDMLDGSIDAANVSDYGNNGKSTVTVAVAGDIVFDPQRPVMLHAATKGGILKCIDEALVDYLNECDVFLLNNEFAISEGGEPLADKSWTFRSDPKNIKALKKMGVDLVSLANNHVYDYGEEAFFDTMKHLKDADLPYVGAGYNVNEAAQGHYFIVNGIKIGIVAASRAEKYYMTPTANFDRAGVLGTYDSRYFLSAIRNAKERCDIVIAYVHWGTEYSTELEEEQITMSREYIDAGADAVIGGHPHCLQGMEFYNDVPIVYSVGNFWFNDQTLDSCVVTLEIDEKLNTKVLFTPLLQEDCETRLLTEYDERRALFDRVESYEPQGVKISDDGVVTPAK